MSYSPVQLHYQHRHVVLDNGILQVTFSNPEGFVTKIQYNGIENLLENSNEEDNRGYWDLVWSDASHVGTTGAFEKIKGTNYLVIVENDEQVELSFSRGWDPSVSSKPCPLNIDKRFIMLRGSSGFYSYAIYERMNDWPAFNLAETRIAFKLLGEKFHYMAIADNRQRFMPSAEDRSGHRSKVLAYPEAVLLVNPMEPEFKGEVDDKYQYSCELKDLQLHGWITSDGLVGLWQITPSSEFQCGGPLKQELSSHVGPVTLAMLQSAHYAGEDAVLKFKSGEYWKKVFGPVYIYLNFSDTNDKFLLWEDAKIQMIAEIESWPYRFPASLEFPPVEERGNIYGRILIRDRYVSDELIPANDAYVGLAAPGDLGSWQSEGKGYQFWTRSDFEGFFSITNIRCGVYNLYAWVPGFIGDYRYYDDISVNPGSYLSLGDLVYEPPRDGPTLWEIGFPDRSAAGFYIPGPNPKYVNKLYIDQEKFRQYGLWERYSDLYPEEDLVFTIGASDYTKDWFFAQVPRKIADNMYAGTTWQIKFELKVVDVGNAYKLRLALASANYAELQIRVNDVMGSPSLFSTGLIGKDNAIARHGIHGLYHLFNVDIPADKFMEGINIIFLTQTKSTSPFQGIMYDYIRLEGPPSNATMASWMFIE